jgi:hypothetical protein
MELLLCTEQVASIHRSVASCESEGCDTALFVGMVTSPVTFLCMGAFQFKKNSQVRDGMWGAAPIEFN